MKLCVPTSGNKGLEEKVYEHFGSAPYFTIVEVETGSIEVVDNQNQHHDHGSCNPMMSITGKGVEAVVTGGMGRRAIEMLNAGGVKVYQANGSSVKELIEAYQKGNLKELLPETACAGHGCH